MSLPGDEGFVAVAAQRFLIIAYSPPASAANTTHIRITEWMKNGYTHMPTPVKRQRRSGCFLP